MIRGFRHKGLRGFFERGAVAGVRPEHSSRLRLILSRLDSATAPMDMQLPGLRLHPLKGRHRGWWAVDVSGNWRVIFRFEGNNAVDVDYLDYQ